jgi:hypothetical protein
LIVSKAAIRGEAASTDRAVGLWSQQASATAAQPAAAYNPRRFKPAELSMKRIGALLFVAAMFVAGPANADSYCIWIQSRVTGEWKIHRCAWFNEYQQCLDAAAKVDGECRPKA